MSIGSVSIIVPIFNEEESIKELYGELKKVLSETGKTFGILLVDDCSTDSSESIIKEIARNDQNVRGIRLSENSKKAGALERGFKEAKEDVIITIDADLQDDPSEIPRMINEIENGADMVSGWKKPRSDSWLKCISSSLMNLFASVLLWHRFYDMNSGFKAYKAKIAKQLSLQRYISIHSSHACCAGI